MSDSKLDRRDFLKRSVITGAAAGLTSEPLSKAFGQGAALQVPRTKVARLGVELPILGMGGSQKFDPRYDKRLHRAVAVGVNYFDTSERYSNGQSQKTLATFVEQVGDRKKVWLTSKVSCHTHPAGLQAPPEHFKNNLEQILVDMRADYLDAFFIHGMSDERFLEPEFIKMGEELKRAGKINFFGFSCHDGNVPELLTKAARVGGVDLIMFRYNFRTYGDTKLNRAMDAAKEAGIALLAMKTMGSVPDDDEKLQPFLSKNFTLPQAKLKAIWADERIDCCVSEMENIQMVQENAAAAASAKQLAMEEFIQLNRLAASTSHKYCLGCSQICESRAGGNLRIADTLRYLMYKESYGDHERAQQAYQRLSEIERRFDLVDLQSATRACPQGIAIQTRLEKARTLLS